MAVALGIEAKPVPAKIEGCCDVLFLGASVYYGEVSSEIKNFVKSLNPENVGRVVVLSTSGLTERAYPQLKKLLSDAGIAVEDDNFHCCGQFMGMHKRHPDGKDTETCAKFVKNYTEKNFKDE